MRRLPTIHRFVFIPLILIAVGCADRTMGFRDGVIEGGQLVEARRDASVLLIDVRNEADYNAGHVAGAIHLDAGQWKIDSLSDETNLTHIAFWRQRIGDAGVNGRDPVVIYDDGQMTGAARIWFILQHFGAANVAVLDGGFSSLKPRIDSGVIRLDTAPTIASAVAFRPDSEHGGSVGLASKKHVMTALDNPRVQVLDTRSAEEYDGTKRLRNPRGGHLPGALNLPHRDLLNADGRLKSRNELAEIFREAGFRKDRPVITHCQSGGRASLAALAAHRAGYRHVLNYYQSFGDWSADAGCPVEPSKD